MNVKFTLPTPDFASEEIQEATHNEIARRLSAIITGEERHCIKISLRKWQLDQGNDHWLHLSTQTIDGKKYTVYVYTYRYGYGSVAKSRLDALATLLVWFLGVKLVHDPIP